MQNNNSQISLSPAPLSSTKSFFKAGISYISIVFTLIALICSCVFLFMAIISVFSNNFNTKLLVQCNSTSKSALMGSTYLGYLNVVQRLVIILDAISIGIFSIIQLLIAYQFVRGDKISVTHKNIINKIGFLVGSLGLLCVGSVCGNCIKILVSLNQVKSCVISQNTSYFYKNIISLTIISSISLFSIIIVLIFFFLNRKSSIRLVQVNNQLPLDKAISLNDLLQQEQPQKSEQQSKQQLNDNFNEQIPEQVNEEISIHIQHNHQVKPQQNKQQKYESLQQTESGKKSRIFSRKLLAQSRYGLSIVSTHKNKTSSEITFGQKDSELLDTPSKQPYLKDSSDGKIYEISQKLSSNSDNLQPHRSPRIKQQIKRDYADSRINTDEVQNDIQNFLIEHSDIEANKCIISKKPMEASNSNESIINVFSGNFYESKVKP